MTFVIKILKKKPREKRSLGAETRADKSVGRATGAVDKTSDDDNVTRFF